MSPTPLSPPPPPLQLRDELETMVLKELLGPGSADEEIIESPGTRYFVGVLAPRKRARAPDAPVTAAVVPPPPAEDDDEETDGEILDGDELALGGQDSTQEGTTDQAPAQDKALIPSSFGMTFSLNLEAKDLQLSAAWGQYVKEVSDYLVSEKTGNPRRVWKRRPRGGTQRLTLKEGPIPPIHVDPFCPEVVVQGLVRKRADHWCVTLFLVNEQQEPERLKDTAWVFQPELMAEGVDGAAVIHKRHTILELSGTDPAVKAENDLLAMLYRRHVEFAVGHGIGVHVDGSPDPNHAVRVRTKVVPSYEVPKTTPPRPEDAEINPAFAQLEGMVLDMKLLAEAHPKQYRLQLKPLVAAYQDWIDREEKRITDPAAGLAPFKHAARQAMARCRSTLRRIEAGLDLLDKDDNAAQAFQFMNRAMWLQRTHSLFAERVRRGDEKPDMGTIDIAENRSWYPFQLAFILLNLPGITNFDHPERSEAPEAVADLLWFPTGGGKTEAYLGLTAYTLGLRRLQGVVEGRSGENGVAVLMRYTLRLLTLQQFQRAAALICACEDIRRTSLSNGDGRWGRTPFRIGLWVGGSTTPNWTSDADEAVKSAHGGKPRSGAVGGVGSPHQLTNCPWCGTKIDPGKHIKVEKYNEGACRTLIYCGAKFGQCKFSLVGYFNSLRELGGMKRLVDDDVRTRLRKMQDRGLASRTLYTPDTVKELTSRLGSTAIPETLDHLEGRFDPAILDQIKARKAGGGDYIARPLDVLLATNMISVGVDVPRLGLMVVAGQPKTTAEYIQATSRVGRQHPGLVCTVFNWARPRDLSHYETFEHYHSTFYQHVEALSVTPFSAGATARGLAALLVSLIRQPGFEFNANDKAMRMASQRGHPYVNEAIEAITRRAELIAGVEAAGEVRQQLKRKMDLWQKRAQRTAQGNQLGYETKKDGLTIGLLRKPSIEAWDEFTCLNSLRDVEPTANLILDDFGMDDEGGDDDEGATP